MNGFNELDCVRLTEDFEDLKCGTEGTIVLKYDESNFEVEFFDTDGDTIGVYTMEAKYLEKI